jgi:hypothetical protein
MDGINGVGFSYSSVMPNRCDAKTTYVLMAYPPCLKLLQGRIRTENLRFAYLLNCDSLISCAAHKK